ncbi:MAG: DUF1343 domain-containing protein, partial [Candidatus Helarchaeota archaeon]|nr:DUF1343 domain-containing protein [Candidatus Helarchaeota archaeon]
RDRDKFLPFETAIFILESIKRLFPMHDIFSKDSRMFELAAGTDKIAQKIKEKVGVENIIKSLQKELKIFKQKRKLYIIY